MIPPVLTPSPSCPTDDQRRGNIYKHLLEMFKPGELFEIRCHLRNEVACTRYTKADDQWVEKPGTAHAISGRFDDPVQAANAIIAMETEPSDVDLVWTTVQPIDPVAAKRIGDRSTNVLKLGARAAGESDMLERRYWFADFDLVRKKGVHASEEERQAGFVRLLEILGDLTTNHGWPEPRIIDSGNGYHCYWIADGSPATWPLWSQCLDALDAKYTDRVLKVDTGVGNASRVAGVPGTWNRGSKYTPTATRPARVRRVIHRPQPWERLTYGTIEVMAGTFKADRTDKPSDAPELVDNAAELLDEYFDLFEIEVVGKPHEKGNDTIYHLKECPFKGSAHFGGIGVTSIMLSDTRIGFSCLHPDHKKHTFKDLTTWLESQTRKRCGLKFYLNSSTLTDDCLHLMEKVWGLDPEDVWVDGQIPVECEDDEDEDTNAQIAAAMASRTPAQRWTRPTYTADITVPAPPPTPEPTVAPERILTPEDLHAAYWRPCFKTLADMDAMVEAMDVHLTKRSRSVSAEIDAMEQYL